MFCVFSSLRDFIFPFEGERDNTMNDITRVAQLTIMISIDLIFLLLAMVIAFYLIWQGIMFVLAMTLPAVSDSCLVEFCAALVSFTSVLAPAYGRFLEVITKYK